MAKKKSLVILCFNMVKKPIGRIYIPEIISPMEDSPDTLNPQGLGSCESSLDGLTDPKGAEGDVSGNPPPVCLGQLAFKYIAPKTDLSSVYFCTFTYNPGSKHSYVSQPKAFDFEMLPDGSFKPWKEKRITRCFADYSFEVQYELFRKHFEKWVKDMNNILSVHNNITGWEVYIEKTKSGLLHAHSLIYSECSYGESFGNYCAATWARISHGQVSAMKRAFEPVRNLKGVREYVKKDLEKNL